MGWQKLGEHEFSFNEGSLNFTLRGGVFNDDGTGVPEGVSFENGRPTFVGIKNLKDFHFDVPRGYIVVNGNEYKLLDLDNNAENGEELQLFKPNVGFPQGNDRTNKAAYKKVGANQFTYNEGSLNYTLTGGAFHDNDGNGIPDGVQIIGPKPCFGADGTVFDTSVENFHFKVPSGALMVNGDLYRLAELDNNPDNGYELIIPDKPRQNGWSQIDESIKGWNKNEVYGWAYRRSADNDPINAGSFRLFGDKLVDNGNGEPKGVTVPVVRVAEKIDGVNVTRIAIDGLNGNVKLNSPHQTLGVYDDDNYGVEIVKHNGKVHETLYKNISPGATVVVTNGTENIQTDGNGVINVLASKPFKVNSFKINNKPIKVDSDEFLSLTLKGKEVAKIKTEKLDWTQKGNKFQFNGRAVNDPLQKVKVTLTGKDLKLNQLYTSTVRNVPGLGIRVGVEGVSGEAYLNGNPIGVLGDDNYSVHFTSIAAPNVSATNRPLVESFALLNISPGATINSPDGTWVIFDGDGVYHFEQGKYYLSTKPAHSLEELQEVNVDEGGADISVSDGVISFVQKVLGAVFGSVVDVIADIFQSFKSGSEEIQLAANELFEDKNFIGDFFNVDELGELVAVKDAAQAPVETSPFKISSELIAAEIVSAEKNNSEVNHYEI